MSNATAGKAALAWLAKRATLALAAVDAIPLRVDTHPQWMAARAAIVALIEDCHFTAKLLNAVCGETAGSTAGSTACRSMDVLGRPQRHRADSALTQHSGQH